ncbi:cytochrome P450 3A11-like [Porites lutea]|uniref:cytochrome P450 3A11-like n=1 Tax=Porites lutea TaxID=51062 RepID=UPI003CC6221B
MEALGAFLQQPLFMETLAHPTVIASLLLLVALFLYWYGTRGFADLKKLNVPGPKPIPFLGNFLEVRNYNGIYQMHLAFLKRYGKVFTICLGGRPSLVVADPELLKQIMVKDFANFRNRFQFQKLANKTLAQNVGSSRDDKWKRIRNTLTPTFSAGKLKLMVPLMEKLCDTLLEKLEKIADSDQSVDMLDWFSKMTLEVILATAFGVDAKIQMGENSEILQEAKKLFHVPFFLRQMARLPFGNSLLRLLLVLNGNDVNYFERIGREMLHIRRQQGQTNRKDLLELMMTATDETTVEGVSRLSDDEVVAQSFIFLLAGFETSSNTLSFTVYHLACNPGVQDKLRSDIRDAFETHANKKPLYEIAQSIEYLDCVIKESQRLCPPVPHPNRECREDFNLNGIHIPAGTEVVIPVYAFHHDPDAWEDPEKFDPERFRGPRKDTHHPFQFLPFGAGPRNCIGMRFALLEIKIALVKILMKYKFVQSPETQVPLVLHDGATMTAKNGVLVRVESVM